jgi:hypothetical protein
MTVKDKHQFDNATKNWDLERLYRDLEEVKGKSLTFVEKLHLKGLLCGYNPLEIAEQLNKSQQGLKTDLSTTIYQYIKSLLGREKLKMESWRNVSEWLEQKGYKKVPNINEKISQNLSIPLEKIDGLIIFNQSKFGENQGTIEINIRFEIPALPQNLSNFSSLLNNAISPQNENEQSK